MQVRSRRVAPVVRPPDGWSAVAARLVALSVVVLLAGCVDDATPGPTTSAGPSRATSTPTPAATPSPSVPAPVPSETTPPAEPPAPSPAPPAAPPTIEVVVTASGWQAATSSVEVWAYTAVLESGGTCTLDLAGPGGATVSTSQQAEPDASTTSCGLLAVPRDRLARGSWTGTVTYTSSSGSGVAAVAPMDVP